MIETTRRTVLAGTAAAAGAAGTAAAAGAAATTAVAAATATAALAGCGGAGSKDGAGGQQGPAGGAIAKTSEIPVGGGKVFADRKVVVTQPAAGKFKAFSAVCTHLGCLVNSVAGGTINCPCHRSMYSIVDGSVKGGPAPSPLAEQPVTVTGTNITVGG